MTAVDIVLSIQLKEFGFDAPVKGRVIVVPVQIMKTAGESIQIVGGQFGETVSDRLRGLAAELLVGEFLPAASQDIELFVEKILRVKPENAHEEFPVHEIARGPEHYERAGTCNGFGTENLSLAY